MNTPSLKEAVEIVGIVAVVASLIFVGVELRQSQRIAMADQYQTRIGFNLDYYNSLSDQEVSDYGRRMQVLLADSSLSDVVKQQVLQADTLVLGTKAIAAKKILLQVDNIHFQHEAGFYDDEALAATRRRLIGTLSGPQDLTQQLLRYEMVERAYQWRASVQEAFGQIVEDAAAAP